MPDRVNYAENDGWAQYVQYARRLDAVRAEESARTVGLREDVAQLTTQANELEARLGGQGGMLTNLAATLRLRPPRLTPLPPSEPVDDPRTALTEVERTINLGDVEARRAATRGEYPALLPKLSGTARAVIVYGIAALGILAFQRLGFSRAGTETNPITVLFVIPLVGFLVAFLVLRLGGRTRVARPAVDSSTRLGLVLCFLIGPVGAAVSVLMSLQSR
jgi:hypothetical protein